MEKDKTVLADPTQKPGSKVNENLANIIFKTNKETAAIHSMEQIKRWRMSPMN